MSETLKEASRGNAGSLRGRRVRDVLVVGEAVGGRALERIGRELAARRR